MEFFKKCIFSFLLTQLLLSGCIFGKRLKTRDGILSTDSLLSSGKSYQYIADSEYIDNCMISLEEIIEDYVGDYDTYPLPSAQTLSRLINDFCLPAFSELPQDLLTVLCSNLMHAFLSFGVLDRITQSQLNNVCSSFDNISAALYYYITSVLSYKSTEDYYYFCEKELSKIPARTFPFTLLLTNLNIPKFCSISDFYVEDVISYYEKLTPTHILALLYTSIEESMNNDWKIVVENECIANLFSLSETQFIHLCSRAFLDETQYFLSSEQSRLQFCKLGTQNFEENKELICHKISLHFNEQYFSNIQEIIAEHFNIWEMS